MNSGFDSQQISDDDIYRFKGAFDLIGHLSNTFGRREICLKPDSKHLSMMFQSVNQAQTLKALQSKTINEDNFKLLLEVLSVIPVKSPELTPELSEFVKDGFSLIQKSYLDHQGLYN